MVMGGHIKATLGRSHFSDEADVTSPRGEINDGQEAVSSLAFQTAILT
jgi:hypothetical protein